MPRNHWSTPGDNAPPAPGWQDEAKEKKELYEKQMVTFEAWLGDCCRLESAEFAVRLWDSYWEYSRTLPHAPFTHAAWAKAMAPRFKVVADPMGRTYDGLSLTKHIGYRAPAV